MIVLHDAASLKHRTIEFAYGKVRDAPESPERIQSVLSALSQTHHQVREIDFNSHMSTILEEIGVTHDAQYLEHLATAHSQWVKAGVIEEHESILPESFPYPTGTEYPVKPPVDMFGRPGYFAFDMSTGIMSETYNAAVASANLAYQGVKLLGDPADQTTASPVPKSIFALCRPPGHHCDTRRAGGFCYINNAVVAASTISRLSRPPEAGTTSTPAGPGSPTSSGREPRVAILDLDFHHGNGTQAAFYSSAAVFYASIHGENEYPYYTGSGDETGAGPGRGHNLNLPLPASSSFEDYLARLSIALAAIQHFRPRWLIVSLGFDTFHLDPLGNFKIFTQDYAEMARQVRGHPGLRWQEDGVKALILLEGGYVIDRLGENAVAFLKGWEEAEGEMCLKHSSGH